MRLAVYTDYVYRQVDGTLYAERAFARCLAALADEEDSLTLVGRLAPQGELRYRLPAEVRLAPLTYYASLGNPAQALRGLLVSLRQLWRALDGIDVLWALGPYPHGIVLVLFARLRRRRVVLGVRQNWPEYVRRRHPQRTWMHRLADAMEWMWRRLARRLPVVAVGGDLATRYAHAPAVLNLTVSLVPARAIVSSAGPFDTPFTLPVLSVGRLDTEKNPLLLADVLSALAQDDPRWNLVVCGDGPLGPQLAARLQELGVHQRAQLLGYVPMGDRLLDLYRSSFAMLHVSHTEGFPQVLIEAFACGLPVVATDVGGVAAGTRDAALLIPPQDPLAAADALRRIAEEPGLRDRLVSRGLERSREMTVEAQVARLASFLADARPARAAS